MNLSNAMVRELEWWLAERASGEAHPLVLNTPTARALERRGLCTLRPTGGSVASMNMAEIRAALREHYAAERSRRALKVARATAVLGEACAVSAFGALVYVGAIFLGAI